MSGNSRVGSAVRRVAARLVPAGRRDWVEAVWAESLEVSPGFERLVWRIGGVRLIAREAKNARRITGTALFALAAAFMAWRGSTADFVTSVYRVDVITVVVLLAGGALLARRWFQLRGDSRTAGFLRERMPRIERDLIGAGHADGSTDSSKQE